jgi:GT2 family glycosyltransferase
MLGIVIVTHNSARVLTKCLESCRKFTEAAVIVVDNASRDESVQVAQAAGVIVCANSENRGFAAAVNQGVNRLDADVILLLNPDAELLSSVDELISACTEPRVGAASGALVDANTRQVQKGFSVRRFPRATTLIFETVGLNRLFPGNPVSRQYRCLNLDYSKSGNVEQPAGAFFLFRRDAWKSVGGFDESFYPIWFEDVDFCKRLIDKGWSIRYVPAAMAAHEGGHSAGKLQAYEKRSYWYVSLLKYAQKHYSRTAFRIVCAAVLLRCITVRGAPRGSLKRVPNIVSPFRLAVKGLLTGSF